jgi:hypothetical protein
MFMEWGNGETIRDYKVPGNRCNPLSLNLAVAADRCFETLVYRG